MRKWVAIRNNYVIAAFIWDGVTKYTYPEPHDLIIEDTAQNIGIGMWYEEAEGNFYYPINRPPDLPEELDYLYEKIEQ